MTNAQIYLETAKALLNNGRLNERESDFINQIKDYTKKQLNGLSSAQFKWLRDIASKQS